MTSSPTVGPSNADTGPAASPPRQPSPPSAANSAPPSQMQDAQQSTPSIDGLEDGRNAWSDEGQSSIHPGRPVPESLRVGPPDASPHRSQELPRPSTRTNPYLQKRAQAADLNRDESSANAWGESVGQPAQPSHAPPAPPVINGMLAISDPDLVELGTLT
jgi:hypothetical protein